MSRCVLLVDSDTGRLIDVSGNSREGGRYRKFVGRILSLDTNPNLDYGANGGDMLVVSNGGYDGKEIILKAKKVTITGNLKVNGETMAGGDGKLDSASVYPSWNSEVRYSAGSSVSHNGQLWTSRIESLGDEPSGTSEFWEEIILGNYIDTTIGQIGSVLDSINGEVI